MGVVKAVIYGAIAAVLALMIIPVVGSLLVRYYQWVLSYV